jgi:N-acetylmuramic acid 6-phosphate etherase
MSDDQDGAQRPLAELASEERHPASHDLDRLSPLAIVQLMSADDRTVAAAVEVELPRIASAVAGIVAQLRLGGRLIYVGAGTSGRLAALDAAECPPTFNVVPNLVTACVAGGPLALESALEDAEDRADLGAADLLRRDPHPADAVAGISASGRTPYVLGALSLARERGAFTIGLACNTDSPLSRLVDVMIAPVVGPEIIAGSTRLKAGTAQKMVLNMLSTATMVLLGKTYGGLMVDVQATNAKLRARAAAIVAEVVGVRTAEAQRLLRQADDEVKTAILMGSAGSSPREARERLSAHGNILRAALEADEVGAE